MVIMTCIPALTQTITGSITGLVTDQSGAVVAGAKVTAINVLTGVATPTVTNPSGIYSLRFLQIGSGATVVVVVGQNVDLAPSRRHCNHRQQDGTPNRHIDTLTSAHGPSKITTRQL